MLRLNLALGIYWRSGEESAIPPYGYEQDSFIEQ